MWNLPNTPDVIVALGTLLAGSAAIWGAYSAQKGLSTWKRQSLWEDERKLAKNLLVSLKEREDAVAMLRNRFSSISYAALSDKSLRWEETKADYNSRLKSFNQARRDFYQRQIEGEIFWGDAFVGLVDALGTLEAKLLVAIEDHLESKRPDADIEDIWSSNEERRENQRLVFGHRGATDAFSNDYIAAAEAVRQLLLPKLELAI